MEDRVTRFVTRDDREAELRPATPDDAEELVAAVERVARERRYFLRPSFDIEIDEERQFLGEFAGQGGLVLVARVDGHLAGWLTAMRPRQAFRQHTVGLGIGVLPEDRGVGIGTRLMENALEWAASVGIERVELGVRAGNLGARRLYERLGFVEEGYARRAVRDDHGEYDDIIHMVRFV